MKKHSLFFIVVLTVIFTFSSCTSTRVFSISRIRHSEPDFAAVPYEAYITLGRVSASATVSYSGNTFEGDTGMYGSLDEKEAIYLNIPDQNASVQPKTAFDAALGNALYKMNEEAEELKADAILFVRTKTAVKTEGSKQTVTVTVSGTAVKLK